MTTRKYNLFDTASTSSVQLIEKVLSTVIMARVLSRWDKQPGKEMPREQLEPSRINWPVVYRVVGFYFVFIVALSSLMQKLAQ